VVLILAALSKTKNYYIAGLVPLFPTFALIAHYIVGKGRSIEDLKTTIVFGMWSIIPYFVYLATLYVMVDRMRLEASLAVAAVAWLMAATVLVSGLGPAAQLITVGAAEGCDLLIFLRARSKDRSLRQLLHGNVFSR
jgi:membrane protein GlpM